MYSIQYISCISVQDHVIYHNNVTLFLLRSFIYFFVHVIYYLFYSPWCQAIINSTITPNMTFTKTSQKFGQWADSRANTVYGLGFSTEQQLQQVKATRTQLSNIQTEYFKESFID